ncbi:MAG: ParB/RepB/Spo0J family partition protein [Holosporaceae bacterium]|jgi:ParB family chromosome partitioning protein|nr:ParB/RepB/Spo0J family partition protein [Holosporaceae bacterium]
MKSDAAFATGKNQVRTKMTAKSLGRGLSTFLDVEEPLSESEIRDIITVDPDCVKPNPFQPRRMFDEEGLQSLAESIKKKGILQPILVLKLGDRDYQLIAGERRLRASKIAGLKEIPALVREIGKEEQLEIAILENVQREDLNPMEEAEAYKRLVEEFGRTHDELAEMLGKSRSHISNMLRLLSLPEEVKNMVRDGRLTFGHARALIGAENPVAIAEKIISGALNVRQTENMTRQRRTKHSNDNFTDPEIGNLAYQISSLLGLKAEIKLKGNGGVVEITFSSLDELDSFVGKLNRRA